MAKKPSQHSLADEEWAPDGGRVIDIGGAAEEDSRGEFAEDWKNLVVFAVDPGTSTGWSVLKVPVGRLVAQGASRTLPYCRWRHGTIQRSMVGTGDMAQAVSDSRHVTLLMQQASKIYDEFVTPGDEDLEWGEDEFVWVLEKFSLRLMSMDTNLLAPVRVLDRLLDRMWSAGSEQPVFFQSPSDAMSTVTDARLRSWGMYQPSSGPHARDADRHAILFLRKFADSRDLRARLGFNL